MQQPPPDTPRSLKVTRDLGGLHYTATTWERARWHLLGVLLLPVVAFLGLSQLSEAAESIGIPVLTALINVLTAAAAVATFTQPLSLLLGVAVLYWFVRVKVSIDRLGMTMVRRRQTERLLWAACADVRRQGRLVSVSVQGRWLPLPSPRSYQDAMWLEGTVRDSVEAREGDATALPAEVTQALRALTGRVSS